MFKKYFKIIKPYNKLLIFFIIIFIITYLLNRFVKSKISIQGIAENKIVFGQSLPLTKNNYHLGIPYSLGYYLAFQNINRKGGINNYKLELLVYDDQYNDKKALENINILVNKSSVFGITTVGTASSTAVADFLYEKNIPFLQPLTGSNLLRSKFKKNIIFTLPSYFNEMQITLNFLHKNNKKNISIIYQNDDFGLSMMNDINFIINSDKFGNFFNIISYSSFELQGILLNKTFAKILGINNPYNQEEVKKSKYIDKIEVIILLSSSNVALESIKYFKQLNPEYYMMLFSFQDVANLIKLNNIKDKYLNNIYTIKLLPSSDYISKNIINSIKNEINFTKEKLLKKKDDYLFIYDTYLKEDNISTILMEGYLNGLFIIEILKSIKNNITRDNFINEIYKRKIINVMGFKFGPYIDFDSCTEEMKKIDNCPCNEGLRTVYLYHYDIIKKKFVYTGFKLDNLKCSLND